LDILFLCHRIPYPPNKGDKIRSHALLKHLAQNHRVHVACFVDDPADMEYAQDVRRLAGGECLFIRLTGASKLLSAAWAMVSGQSVTAAYFSSRAIGDWIKTIQGKYSIRRTVVFCSAMAPFALNSASVDVRHAILDLVDIDSDKWRQYAVSTGGLQRWLYRREAEKVFELERTAARRFGATLLASELEAESFARLVPEAAPRVLALPNGVDCEYFAPVGHHNPFPGGEEPIVMTGRMDYRPNVDGAKWFFNEVLPRVLKDVPRARFYAVGTNPPSSLRALCGSKLVVTGRVDDVRPYLQFASAVVAPLRIARGVQNKVLEAMAMAKPMVATREASRALAAKSGVHLWIKDDARAFADATVCAIQGKERSQIARHAREYVEHHHDWTRNLALLDRLLAEAVKQPGAEADAARKYSAGTSIAEALP
jgi:sugar transferase (PEP-CTERM/EpsH1 system associated)